MGWGGKMENQMIKEELLSLCKQFINLAQKLLKENKITEEEYLELTKYKVEFIKEYGNKLGMN